MNLAIFILVASPFLFFACYMLWVGISAKRRAGRARSWQTVEGRIVESQVKHEIRQGVNGDRFYYRPEVVYEYHVAGQNIRGDRIHIDYVQGVSEKAAQQTVASYPVGSPVLVYYNPKNPSESVLQHKELSLKLAWGIFIFVVALLSFIFWADYAGGCKKLQAISSILGHEDKISQPFFVT